MMWTRRLKQKLGQAVFTAGGAIWRMGHRAQSPVDQPATILVLNLLRIGDTLVTLPALESLRHRYPQARITLVVRELTSPLVQHLSSVDEVLVHKGDNSRESCRRLVEALPKVDTAVVFDTSPWVSWAARLAGARDVIAYDSYGRGFAATRRLPAPPMWNVALPDYQADWEVVSQCEAWMNLLRPLGVRSGELRPHWPVPSAARKRSTHWLESRHLTEFVHVHPGSDPSYRWPVERWREYLSKQTLPVVLGGAAFEKKLLEDVARDLKDVHIWCGEGDLSDYGALLAQAQHVASVDTSAAHLAAAVGTPLTVLFGPGDPQIWGPRGRSAIDILAPQEGCRGCKAAQCHRPTHECLDQLSVEQVLKSQKTLL